MQVISVVGIRKRSFVLDFQKKLMEVLSFLRKEKRKKTPDKIRTHCLICGVIFRRDMQLNSLKLKMTEEKPWENQLLLHFMSI